MNRGARPSLRARHERALAERKRGLAASGISRVFAALISVLAVFLLLGALGR